MAGLLRCSLPWLLLLGAWTAVAVPAPACPFCSGQGQTLSADVKQATMVLFGTLKRDGARDGYTNLEIKAVVKRPENKADDKKFLGDRKVIPLRRVVEATATSRFLVFCDIFKDNVDPYKGIEVKPDSNIAKYLKGAIALQDAKIGKRLRFFFDYLDDKDTEVANDAYKEFANADYRDYQGMAKDLPADKIAGWLENKNKETAPFRFGLYASLLGHCGKPKHADLLRGMLDNAETRANGGVDGLLAGYMMLKPKEGWKYVRGILDDPKKEFLLRYAALKTVRFLWTYRTDLVSKKDLVKGVLPLLEQGDIADLAIDDLRKWEQWDQADQVMGLRNSKVYDVPVVRRAVLRFALSCKGNKAADAYVAAERKKDADGVAEVEELLKLDQATPAGTPASK